MRDRMALVAVALASMGVRLIPIDAEEARNQLLHRPIGRRDAKPRDRQPVMGRNKQMQRNYIHIDKPVSKRRARRLRGKAKA